MEAAPQGLESVADEESLDEGGDFYPVDRSPGSGRPGSGHGRGDERNEDDYGVVSVDVDVSGKLWEMPLLECSPLLRPGGGTVEGLYVYNNAFSLMPRSIWQFSQLKTLKFFGNEINVLPPETGDVLELEKLQVKLSWPGFSGIPFRKLTALKELELSNASARSPAFSILTEIIGLTCLTKLSICHLSIRYLPPEIGFLKKLEELDLSFNKLKSLPNDLSELNSLKLLKVSNNKLVDLPSGLSCLQRLENLDLSNNRLTSLGSLELSSMHSLHYLNLQYNKLNGCQVPSWVYCTFEGNEKDICKDDCSRSSPAYRGVIDDAIQGIGMNHSHNGSVCSSPTSSDAQFFSRCNASRRMKKKWTRRHYFHHIARVERLNHNRKFKSQEHGEFKTKKWAEKWWLHDLSLFTQGDFEMRTHVNEEVILKNPPKPISILEKPSGSEDDKRDDSNLVGNTNDKKIDSLMRYQKDDSSCITSADACLNGLSDGEPELDSSSTRLLKSKVLDEGSSSEESKNSLTSKRHCDVSLDNPKRKCHRPFEGCSCLSCKYSSESYCGIDDHIPDGFYDAGRDRRCMPLCNYDQSLCLDSREVIILDRETDEELDAIALSAKNMLSKMRRSNSSEKDTETVDDLHRASMLALFVSDIFGGSDRSYTVLRMRHSVLGSPEQRPFVCTCSIGNNNNVKEKPRHTYGASGNINFADLSDKSLRMTKEARNSVIVPIGAVRFGVCRHRAVLMKYLCDRAEPPIPCELVRGYLDFLPHAWNAVFIKQEHSSIRMVVDACYPADIREETDPEYFCRYIPLSRTYIPFPNESSAIPGPFPSLPFSFRDHSATMGCVKRCKFGTLTAAAKVRRLEICGISDEDIKIFEYTFLGELRMLGALRKHKCIVEIYGHHLSSKWVASSKGKREHQVLQSAIIMEYIKGGSLKNYLRKLSEMGEKHIPLNLALYIARDVACALVEVHSKHIIHRDIKSDNVLIDLDSQRKDSAPIVKLCDFDRAVPLYSFLHTCCISHLGIHPPDVCVGTPCWMAPEVLLTIHERAVYGLEVDIWSFGCLILELLTLKIPYEGLSDSEVQELLQRKQRPQLTPWLEELSLSDGLISSSFGLLYSEVEIEILKLLVDLFYKCTKGNPFDRPTARQIYDALCQVKVSA
ncbi:unnamed protein product [Spirodela intermedia]|uniref:Protein kinase domain-containing protein n=1 Tax=Spirodela intermedia TaxID=51605 RepID=A0A7I8KAU3_SPIIN|nr:unnamed protein product [Spirodela intermedia]